MEIKEVFEDVGKELGKNPMLVVGLVFLGMFAISYMIQTNEEESNVSIEGAYASYPDAVTNADEIQDNLQQEMTYNTDIVTENLNDNFSQTNEYLQEAISSIEELKNIDFNDYTANDEMQFIGGRIPTSSTLKEYQKKGSSGEDEKDRPYSKVASSSSDEKNRISEIALTLEQKDNVIHKLFG